MSGAEASTTAQAAVFAALGDITRDRSGRLGRYRFEPRVLEDARSYLGQVSAHWDDALARLKTYVEKENP